MVEQKLEKPPEEGLTYALRELTELLRSSFYLIPAPKRRAYIAYIADWVNFLYGDLLRQFRHRTSPDAYREEIRARLAQPPIDYKTALLELYETAIKPAIETAFAAHESSMKELIGQPAQGAASEAQLSHAVESLRQSFTEYLDRRLQDHETAMPGADIPASLTRLGADLAANFDRFSDSSELNEHFERVEKKLEDVLRVLEDTRTGTYATPAQTESHDEEPRHPDDWEPAPGDIEAAVRRHTDEMLGGKTPRRQKRDRINDGASPIKEDAGNES